MSRWMIRAGGAAAAAAAVCFPCTLGAQTPGGDVASACRNLHFALSPTGERAVARRAWELSVDAAMAGAAAPPLTYVTWSLPDGARTDWAMEGGELSPAEPPADPGRAMPVPADRQSQSATMAVLDDRRLALHVTQMRPEGMAETVAHYDLMTGERLSQFQLGEARTIAPPPERPTGAGAPPPFYTVSEEAPGLPPDYDYAAVCNSSFVITPGRGARRHGTWAALPRPMGECGLTVGNLDTGEARILQHHWPRIKEWRVGSDGQIVWRLVRYDGRDHLEVPDGDGWREVLGVSSVQDVTLELFPPAELTRDTQAVWVVADIGRDAPAPGLLDLTTGEIAYAELPADLEEAGGVQLSPDGAALYWTVTRPDPVDAPTFRFGAAPAGPDADLELHFASAEARRVYESIKGEADHARILEWTADGAVALVETSTAAGYDVDAVTFGEGGRIAQRTALCAAERE